MAGNLKEESFFYGQITAAFFPYETFALDAEALALSEKLKEKLARIKKPYEGSYALCELSVYTKVMVFNWSSDVPQEYRNFETWWKMVQDGEPFEKAFVFYADNVHNQMVQMWWKAKLKAHEIWKPSDEKSPNQQNEQEKADPNSQSDNA